MKKIRVELDVSSVDKNKIVNREWTDKQGVKQTKKIYAFDLVELEKPKVIFSGQKNGKNLTVKKTHFGAEPSKKNDDGTWPKTKYVADGVVFETGLSGQEDALAQKQLQSEQDAEKTFNEIW